MRVLVLYHGRFTRSLAILHYLAAIKRHSVHEVEYFNFSQTEMPPDLSEFDAVLLNFCVVSFARFALPPFMRGLILTLRSYRGVKIAAVQDEYDFTNNVKAFFLEIGVDVVLTNVPADSVREVYCEWEFDEVRFCSVQTAYLAGELLSDPTKNPPLAERPISLGYRGRRLPYRLGDLAWHKSEVGLRFKAAGEAAGLQCDIEVDESRRFHGDEWIDFVRSCRVTLGSPSGSNVFDFDGALHRGMQERYTANPAMTYADVRDEIAGHAAPFEMGQVSARIYEAVASRTALALVRGSYSGVVEPDEHYVPIEPDYSNIDDVFRQVLDVPTMQQMADRAYDHVVGNPRNHYAHLVALIDAQL